MAKKKKRKKAHKKTGKKARKKSSKKRRKTVAQHHKSHVAAGRSYAEKAQAHIKASDVLKGAKRKRGKLWKCAGPVRTGCGGSGSRVVGKVRR